MKKDDQQVQSTGHIYDGIEELNNPPPPWFQLLFLVTILFGVGYYLYFSVGNGNTQTSEYQISKTQDQILSLQASLKEGNKPITDEELKLTVTKSENKILGSAIFQSKCVSCHGNLAQGGIGPNLIDQYWIHGGKLTQIFEIISNGVLDKGMPPWSSLLKKTEMIALVSYINSVQGTKATNAKEPQGVLFKK